ncbi:hypothetical protein HOLleu_05820 [Holothuria leucospilota]|uniref:Uncharacterized protein n=1 Tax=Holothuria leucospilota TaxID=206669 RepID=A0A9Q1HJ93_HOLLE|nr:hypothetical protein HOLleu_05820 [Holothuria leucospilota]
MNGTNHHPDEQDKSSSIKVLHVTVILACVTAVAITTFVIIKKINTFNISQQRPDRTSEDSRSIADVSVSVTNADHTLASITLPNEMGPEGNHSSSQQGFLSSTTDFDNTPTYNTIMDKHAPGICRKNLALIQPLKLFKGFTRQMRCWLKNIKFFSSRYTLNAHNI